MEKQTQFPINALPLKVQKIILALEKALNFPRDYISTAIILTAAASIGKTFKLRVRQTWFESTCIFICLVGRPGMNKSHPLTWAINPLMDATERNFAEALERKSSNHEEDYFDSKIPEPAVEQYVANNITPEAMAQIMAEINVRLLIWSDEISGFLRNINKYNTGSDTEFLLSVFSNQTALINRKTQNKMIIKQAYACIGGTTQPDVLKSLFKSSEHNGLFDRFVFAVIEDLEKMKMSKVDLDPEVIIEYNSIINRLLDLSMNSNGDSNIICFSPDAQEEAFNWYDANADKINEEADDRIRGNYTKLETYFFRFSLILQIFRWACDESEINQIDVESVRCAIELTEYFREMNVKALHIISPDPVDSMTDLQRKVYTTLLHKDGEFTTSNGVYSAIKAGMSERNFKYFLKRQDLFKRVKVGVYKKLF